MTPVAPTEPERDSSTRRRRKRAAQRSGVYFTAISRLVNAVPVYGVTIPWGPPFDPSTVTVLARLATGEAESDGSGPGPPTTTVSAPGA